MLCRSRALCCGLLLVAFLVEAAAAQRVSGDGSREESNTIVEFEILTPRIGTGLNAQKWGPIFEKIGVSVRFRLAIANDKPGIDERTRGTLRIVTVIGEMDLDGTLQFEENEFTMSESTKLAEWIDELTTYGAQGSPAGKPVWGLTEEQFTAVYDALRQPAGANVKGLELTEALHALDISEDYAVRLHSSADEHLESAGSEHPVRTDVDTLSGGTSLAIVLADFGLGFQPLRTPRGDVELVIHPLSDISDPWPVGWEIKTNQPRNKIAPNYFAMVTAGFDDLPLEDVLDAVSQKSDTPIIVNYERCLAHKIDPGELTVSYPRKRTAWALLVRNVTAEARLTRKLLLDEAGRPFVYVYPFEPKRPKD